jgi:hypothetical protein
MTAAGRVAAVALLLAVLLAVAMPLAAANHPQSEGGRLVVFDHKAGGNEWWVEVILSGQDAGSVAAVHAMDDAGPWVAMHKTSYGSWAASFRIEPGNPVKFRATWAGGAEIRSCWFSHPQGAEACGGPGPDPPPPAGRWTNGGAFATVPNGVLDMGIGDADRDGTPELYGGGRDGLFRFWRVTPTSAMVETVAPGQFFHVAVGDGDRDGRPDLYASGYNESSGRSELRQFVRADGAWRERLLAADDRMDGPFTLGDVDRDGLRELYVTGSEGVDTTVTRLRFASGAWQSDVVARFHADTTYNISPNGIWAGDADGDGQVELVVTAAGKPGPFLYMVDYAGGAWSATRVAVDNIDGVVAGDVDGDGRGEIAGMVRNEVHVYRLVAGTWTDTIVMTIPVSGLDLFLGDGDNDGSQELYTLSYDDHVYQVRKWGSSWLLADMGTTPSFDDYGDRIIVGDADGDGKREVYTSTFDSDLRYGHLTQFKWVPLGFDATFTGVRGNEWWQQVAVSAGGSAVANVDVRLNGGDWKPLARQSWGGWAASYRAVQGTVVQFRATSSTGQTDLSDCYQWIPPPGTDATQVPCGSPPPAFDASFSNVKGNNWWVEARVTANQPIAKVEARVDCGATWQALALQSWGSYAKSFHVPSGSKVDFRATSASGATDLSGGYVWPQATPTSACP